MGASGHIAGVINPPGAEKRSYWTGNFPAPTPEAWDSKGERAPGSWWPHWYAWLAPHSGKRVAAPKQPKSKLGAAPGTYVTGESLITPDFRSRGSPRPAVFESTIGEKCHVLH